jgi:hypothetical protein
MGLAWLTGCGRNFRSGAGGAVVALAVLPGSGTAARAGLTITPTFDSSITSDPNSAAIIGVINTAIGVYQAKFADPINVTIRFEEMTTGLGRSNWWYYNIPYQTFINHLVADQTTADDATALSHLPTGPNNPVNGGSSINVKTANLRAIGILGLNSGLPGGVDGIIGLNTHITDVGSPGTTGQYSLLATVEHEIDEILGLASDAGGGLIGNAPLPEDLYRYDNSGNRSYTPNPATAFFSIDGTTLLAQFNNQNNGGDYGDWQSTPRPAGVPPQVQDAFATPGAHPTLGVNELTALDVIGYDPVAVTAVPEPASLTLLAAGGAVRRRLRLAPPIRPVGTACLWPQEPRGTGHRAPSRFVFPGFLPPLAAASGVRGAGVRTASVGVRITAAPAGRG